MVKRKLTLELETDSDSETGSSSSDDGAPVSVSFKRIRKEDALKIKQDSGPCKIRPPETVARGITSTANHTKSVRRAGALEQEHRHSRHKEQQPDKRDLLGSAADDVSSRSGSGEVDLMVHRLTPPFLDARDVLSSHTTSVDVVRDRTGDLYKFSAAGSATVVERRRLRDRRRNAREVVGVEDDVRKNKSMMKGAKKKAKAKGPDYKAILLQRHSLPAYRAKQAFLQAVRENQVVVVVGETGSGKTTQLPQFLYEAGYHTKGGRIGVTQPRRMAAEAVARRVSQEMQVQLGHEVGYTIRFDDVTSAETRIQFMTEGILLRETLQDADLDKYSVIMMDEAHERSLNTDVLLGLFKTLLTRRRDLRLIVTSATMNADKFSQFFGNAEQFAIPGRTFPVETLYGSIATTDYVKDAVKQALRVHIAQKAHRGDILVFMTGQEDIEATCEGIEDELESLRQVDNTILPLEILPVHSSLAPELQARIFEPSANRKCIVATNIAETSLTVDGVKYVVDTGLMKVKVYNAQLGMDALQIAPISLAQANQRAGRAGRTAAGTCYRLYTLLASKTEMFAEPIPEIQRTNLDNTVLLLKSLHVDNLGAFPFLDRPSTTALSTAQYELWACGALDDHGKLTALGSRMSCFPIQPTLSKFLILSAEPRFHSSESAVSIVAMLSVPPVFIRPNNDAALQRKSDALREKFQIPESDHLTLLNVYNQFASRAASSSRMACESWCTRNFLQYKALRRAQEIREQLVQIMCSNRLPLSRGAPDWDAIRECVCAAFFANAGVFKKYGVYQHLRSGMEMALQQTSALHGMGDLPRYVVYHEVVLTGRMQHMTYVTAVQGSWLAAYGSIFYSRRVKGVTSRENQRRKEEEYRKRLKGV